MNEFKPRLVLDSRINDITDKIDIAVESSAAQSTYQPFRSVNSSNSSITFNVNVPSENIAIDRRILIQTVLEFEVNITGAPVSDTVPVFQWGKTDGLGQFPLNSLFSQVQATINNVSVSSPVEDIMPSLLRMCDQKEVSKYNLLTASYLDQNFSTLEGCEAYASNPLAGMGAVNYDFRFFRFSLSFSRTQLTRAQWRTCVKTAPLSLLVGVLVHSGRRFLSLLSFSLF